MRAGEPLGQVFLAPAKLNLFLHVVGRRPDGYHLIQSAMQLIDLADELTISTRTDGRIERAYGPADIPPEHDLAIRAARLLQTSAGSALGANIGVTKRIPVGGGLGGGSSDAATTLLALNRLWGLDWPRERLMKLGLALGADVPFFIGGGDAFVEGIGEQLTPIVLDEAAYVVIHPGVAVPTAAIFRDPELTRDTATLKISDFAKNASGVAAHKILRNDLEPVATKRFDAVRDARAWLSQDFEGASGLARMSGSGACVFRAFERRSQADLCLAALVREANEDANEDANEEANEDALRGLQTSWSGWSVRSLAVHPHRELAADRG